jgi:glucose 1-dehydrogenase
VERIKGRIKLRVEQLLKGQKALITGASSGIGKEIALALAQAGADVVINYFSHEEEAQDVIKKAQSYGIQAIAIHCDVSKEKQVQNMFKKAIKTFGTLDILINNSGVQKDAPFDEMSLDQWNTVIQTNLTGSFLCSKEAVREFKRRGVIPEVSCAAGKIIFISSVHEVIPWAGHVNYTASKGGIKLLMQSLAQEVAPNHIRVNSIAPGAIRTPINRESWETSTAIQDLMKLIPYKRIGDPEDIAKVAVWMASDEADYITGVTLFVDGGMTLYPAFASGG